MNGLYLTDQYKSNAIKAVPRTIPRTIHEYECMKDENVIAPNANCGMLADNSIMITLLKILQGLLMLRNWNFFLQLFSFD